MQNSRISFSIFRIWLIYLSKKICAEPRFLSHVINENVESIYLNEIHRYDIFFCTTSFLFVWLDLLMRSVISWILLS